MDISSSSGGPGRYQPIYSLQAAGPKFRVLATTTGPTSTTRAVITLPDPEATAAVGALGAVVERHLAALVEHGRDHPTQVCCLRRHLVSALRAGEVLPGRFSELTALAASFSVAERRALADEVGAVLAASEDIIVIVALCDEFGGLRFECLANRWLAGSDDEELFELLCDDNSDYLLYESLLAELRAGDYDIDDACDREWVDVHLHRGAVRAWIARMGLWTVSRCGARL